MPDDPFFRHVERLTAKFRRAHGLAVERNPRVGWVELTGNPVVVRFDRGHSRAPHVHCWLIAPGAAGDRRLTLEWYNFARALGVFDVYCVAANSDYDMSDLRYEGSPVEVAQIAIFLAACCGPLFDGEPDATALLRRHARPAHTV